MAKEILIADSDKAGREGFQEMFATTDYHLVFCESGEDALRHMKLFRPDLIIAGNTLKEKTGFELCEAIKNDLEFKDIPFILLSDLFEEVSERDRKRVHADGVILKPLREDEILSLVDQLMKGEKEKEDFLLDEPEEEIIELVDVVEEQESRLNIDDFIAPEIREPTKGVTSLESWERPEGKEGPSEEEIFLSFEEKAKEAEGVVFHVEKEETEEDEFFQKIELDEVLEKVEKLKPSLEKEWPVEKGPDNLWEEPFKGKEAEEKDLSLEEFEAALQKEVLAGPVVGDEELTEERKPLIMEEPDVGIPKMPAPEIILEETPEGVPEEILVEEELNKLIEEEFPESLFEDLEEEEVRAIEEPQEIWLEEIRGEEIRSEEIKPEEIKLEVEEHERGRLEEAKFDWIEGIERPEIGEKEMPPLAIKPDSQMERAISEGIQKMMEDFITKILPEMTQNLIGLTMERIEKMVKEIVPDLAEKAIQEEIKRLQKGEEEKG